MKGVTPPPQSASRAVIRFGERAEDKSFRVTDADFTKAVATKNGFFCVAIARKPQGVAVRDTKDPTRKTLFFNNKEWAAFLDGAKKGEFDV